LYEQSYIIFIYLFSITNTSFFIYLFIFFFFLMIRRPPRSTLFPYTTALPIFSTIRARRVATPVTVWARRRRPPGRQDQVSAGNAPAVGPPAPAFPAAGRPAG